MSRTVLTYVLRQALVPATGALLALATIVWMTQSLQLVDLVLNRGQSAATLFRLTLLGLPTLLTAIAPFAFLIGLIFALHRMTAESETVAFFASGLSRVGFAAPLACASLIAMAALASLSLWAAPAGARSLKAELIAIRADLAVSLVRPGAFTHPVDGVTVYARSASRDGVMRELMLQDRRDPARSVTYLARTAELMRTEGTPLLVMKDGSIQSAAASGEVDVLSFREYAFDASHIAPEQALRAHEAGQRYLHELLFPDPEVHYDRRVWDDLVAAGHARLSNLLYLPAFSAITVGAATAAARRGRRAHLVFLVALAIGFAAKLVGFFLETAAAAAPALNAVQYAWPGALIVAALFGASRMAPATARSQARA